MSSASDPINNVESNAGSFRTGNHRQAGDPPRPEMKRRVLDIQDVLVWAYKQELPKDRGLGGAGEPCAVSPMFAMGAFGTRVDYFHREPGFPAAVGPPHPDALLVEAAVERVVAAAADQSVEDDPLLLPDFGEFGVDEREAVRRALGMLGALLARCAKLERPPFWSESSAPGPIYSANGRPTVARLEPIFSKTVTGEEVEHEALVPVEPRVKGEYPFGSHSPLIYDPTPESIAHERAEYLVWWGALAAIAAELEGKLATIAVLSPGAPQRPWIDRRALAAPPRVFADQRAGIYRREQRETAAAHRALGLRRSHPARGPAARRGVLVRRVQPAAVEGACAAG